MDAVTNELLLPSGQQLAQALPFTNFDAPLAISYDPAASKVLGKDYWRVNVAFRFYVGARKDNRWVYVPAGFLTDGATVPRPFWSILPPWGMYGQAAVVHDILCETQTLIHNDRPEAISRKDGDKIFLEAMKVAGVRWFARSCMYAAVRVYGWFRPYPNWGRVAKKRVIEAEYIDPSSGL